MKKRKKNLKKIINKNIKNLTFLKVSAFLFYAFVFLMPFQIDVVVYTRSIFESGNFNPYTSFFYYLGDFVFLIALLTWGIAIIKGEAKNLTYGKWAIFILLILFVAAGEVSVLFSDDKLLSLMLLLRFVEFALMYLYMVNDVVKLDVVINVFIASVSFQATIAILQYIYQGSIGLHMLGEPNINGDIPGVAKIDIDGMKIIRSYGTFQHPNILGGYLVTAIFLVFYRIKQKEYIAYPIIFLLFAALILTFSRSAILSLIVASLFFISIKNLKISLKYIFLALSLLILFAVIFNLEQIIFNKLLFTDTASFNERVFYFSIAKKIMYASPFGIGLGNFTLIMPDFTNVKLAPWDFQPVHNIYMLMLNEIGVQGVVLLFALLIVLSVYLFVYQNKVKSSKYSVGSFILACLVAISVIGLFDHYPLSIYQGQLLLFFIFGLSGKYLTLKNH